MSCLFAPCWTTIYYPSWGVAYADTFWFQSKSEIFELRVRLAIFSSDLGYSGRLDSSGYYIYVLSFLFSTFYWVGSFTSYWFCTFFLGFGNLPFSRRFVRRCECSWKESRWGRGGQTSRPLCVLFFYSMSLYCANWKLGFTSIFGCNDSSSFEFNLDPLSSEFKAD